MSIFDWLSPWPSPVWTYPAEPLFTYTKTVIPKRRRKVTRPARLKRKK